MGGEKHLLSSHRSPWKRLSPLCHPEHLNLPAATYGMNERGLWGCRYLPSHSMEAPPSPLSSRAKPRDLQFQSFGCSELVIPTGAKRSGGTCCSLARIQIDPCTLVAKAE